MQVGDGAMPCFWMEPVGRARVGLRRYVSGGEHTHDASVISEIEFTMEWEEDEYGWRTQKGVPGEIVPSHDDPRWPTVCVACGQTFVESDEWQAFSADGYARSDTGETVWARHVLGLEWAGALYHAEWLAKLHGKSPYHTQDRGDGIVLIAVCPNGGMWVVDGKASSGGFWERTGDPRKPETLTVSPSIVCGPAGHPDTYHGFLQAGNFTAHVG